MGWKCFLLLFKRHNIVVSMSLHLCVNTEKPLLQTMQFHNHAQQLKVKNSGGPLDNQTWQTEGKTAPLAKVQLCEYKNQTLGVFVAVSHLYTKFDCSVVRQNFSLLATVYDSETG